MGGKGVVHVCHSRLDHIAWFCLTPLLTKKKEKGTHVESSHTWMCVSSHERETAVISHRVWGRKERTEGEENEVTVSVFQSQETLVSKRRIFMSPDCAFSNCQTKDWWTYEFCYGRHIQQYHMEGEAAYVSPRPSLV